MQPHLFHLLSRGWGAVDTEHHHIAGNLLVAAAITRGVTKDGKEMVAGVASGLGEAIGSIGRSLQFTVHVQMHLGRIAVIYAHHMVVRSPTPTGIFGPAIGIARMRKIGQLAVCRHHEAARAASLMGRNPLGFRTGHNLRCHHHSLHRVAIGQLLPEVVISCIVHPIMPLSGIVPRSVRVGHVTAILREPIGIERTVGVTVYLTMSRRDVRGRTIGMEHHVEQVGLLPLHRMGCLAEHTGLIGIDSCVIDTERDHFARELLLATPILRITEDSKEMVLGVAGRLGELARSLGYGTQLAIHIQVSLACIVVINPHHMIIDTSFPVGLCPAIVTCMGQEGQLTVTRHHNGTRASTLMGAYPLGLRVLFVGRHHDGFHRIAVGQFLPKSIIAGIADAIVALVLVVPSTGGPGHITPIGCVPVGGKRGIGIVLHFHLAGRNIGCRTVGMEHYIQDSIGAHGRSAERQAVHIPHGRLIKCSTLLVEDGEARMVLGNLHIIHCCHLLGIYNTSALVYVHHFTISRSRHCSTY